MDKREIKLYIDDESFLYDVQGLVMAFYPGRKPVSTTDPKEAELAIRVPEGDDRRMVKNTLKKELYHRLSGETGRSLPWGTLTGVRPTKIVLRLIAEGRSHGEIIDKMRKEYLTSEDKARLSADIAFREAEMIGELYGSPYSATMTGAAGADTPVCLYIGIPFCPSICLYCSFSSYAIGAYKDTVDDYILALKEELRGAAGALGDRHIAAVYFGGGTPTSLSAEQIDGLLAAVSDCFDLSVLPEYTVEAGRPDSITREKLEVLSHHGVDRISINPQTLQQQTLDTIGRRHTVEDFYRAYTMAREYSFIINTDLIVGLPGEGEPEVADTLRRVADLSPDNLTVHSLARKRASRLTEEWEEYADEAFVYTDAIEHIVYDTARQLDMEPYYMYRQKNIAGNMENVGFAHRGEECLYNVLMMEEACDIAAFGAGAVSKRMPIPEMPTPEMSTPKMPESESSALEKTRSGLYAKADRLRNPKDVKNYINRIAEVTEKKQNFF